MADALGIVQGQVNQAVGMVGGLISSLTYIEQQVGGEKTFQDLQNAPKLVEGMQALGKAIGLNFADIGSLYDWAQPVVAALDGNPVCDSNPSCAQTRDQLHQVLDARDDGTFDKLADLGRQLQSIQLNAPLDSTTKKLKSALDSATKALRAAGLDSPSGVQTQLAQLQQGADRLADASRQIADGVKLLVDSKQISSGLSEASKYLLSMKADANKQQMAGFYIPPDILTGDEFKKAVAAFISRAGPMTMVNREVINDQIIRGYEKNSQQRETQLNRHLPGFLSRFAADFAGVQGSGNYRALQTGELSYQRYTFAKDA